MQGTVTAVRPGDSVEPCFDALQEVIGTVRPEVVIDLQGEEGQTATFGVETPGFDPSVIQPGAVLGLDFSVHYYSHYGDQIAHLVVREATEVLVAVAENEPVGLDVSQGAPQCASEGSDCSYTQFSMNVRAPDSSQHEVLPEESADIGGLLVTNASYYEIRSIGNCESGLDVTYHLGVAATR